MRHAAGLTQRELAARLEREHSFVWRIEKGERRLDLVEFRWLCHELGFQPDEVFADLTRKMDALLREASDPHKYRIPPQPLKKVAESRTTRKSENR